MTTKKLIVTTVIAVSSAISFVGCTTASYGLKPIAVEEQQDTYKFKLFVGGFSGGETADKAVRGDIDAYQKNNGYEKYTILDKRYNLIPSYFEYTVRFSR